jgi:hypothetical protein
MCTARGGARRCTRRPSERRARRCRRLGCGAGVQLALTKHQSFLRPACLQQHAWPLRLDQHCGVVSVGISSDCLHLVTQPPAFIESTPPWAPACSAKVELRPSERRQIRAARGLVAGRTNERVRHSLRSIGPLMAGWAHDRFCRFGEVGHGSGYGLSTICRDLLDDPS